MTLELGIGPNLWLPAKGYPSRQKIARELADRHYPRQTPGSPQVAPPGRRWVLVVNDASGIAVWVVCENMDPAGGHQFRCSLFRNESAHLSSTLIIDATALTYERWHRRGWLAAAPRLRTEVDGSQVRRKRDPGRCFKKAGWTPDGTSGGKKGRSLKHVFEAPLPTQLLPLTEEES